MTPNKAMELTALRASAHSCRWADRKMRPLLAVLVGVVVFWPTPASANMGLPMVAIYLPAAWFALVPIIAIEAGYGVWRLGLPARHAFVSQTIANCASTLIGIPVMWVILALGQVFVGGWLVGVTPEPLLAIVSPLVGAAWLGPGAEDTWWMVPLAVAVLTMPFYVMSVVTEGPILGLFFRNRSRELIRRWTVRANAMSYTFLVVLVLVGWLLPRASQPLFEFLLPLNERLVRVVVRLASQDGARRLARHRSCSQFERATSRPRANSSLKA